MISAIQNFLQKHHKWAFSILLVIVIVAFVFTIGNMGAGGPVADRGPEQHFYGFDLSNNNVRNHLEKGATLSMVFNNQYNPNMPQDFMEQRVKARALMLSLASQLNLPDPSRANLKNFNEPFAEFVRTQPFFQDEEGNFLPERVDMAVAFAQNALNVGESYVNQVLYEDWRIDQAYEAVAGPGYVLPWEARHNAIQRNADWSVLVAQKRLADFTPEINPTDDEVQQYYALNQENYEVPVQWNVDYLFFPTQAYMAKAEAPTEEAIEDYYAKNKVRFTEAGAEEPKPLEDVRPEIEATLKEQDASDLAIRAADDFINYLHSENIERGSPTYAERLKLLPAQAGELPSFSQQSLPANSPVPRTALRNAFTLTEGNWYSDAIPGQGGAYVLLFKGTEPAYIPELEDVRTQVVADLKESRRREAFREHLETVVADLRSAVETGQSFEDVAKEKGLAVNRHEKFKLTSPPAGFNYQLLNDLPGLNEGEVEERILGDTAHIVYVMEKIVPEIAEDSDKIEESRETFASRSRMLTSGAILQDLMAQGEEQLQAQRDAAQ